MFQCFPMMNVKKSLNLKSNINNVISFLNQCCLSFIFLGHAFDLRAFSRFLSFSWPSQEGVFWEITWLLVWAQALKQYSTPSTDPTKKTLSFRLLLNEDSNNCHDVSFFSISLYKPKHVWLPPQKRKRFSAIQHKQCNDLRPCWNEILKDCLERISCSFIIVLQYSTAVLYLFYDI